MGLSLKVFDNSLHYNIMMALRLHCQQLFNKFVMSQCFNSMIYRGTYVGVKFVQNHTLTEKNADISNSAEEYLRNIGANVEKIHKEVKFSRFDLCEKLKSVSSVLGEQCDLEPSDVGRMVTKRPRILLLEKEQMERRVAVLRNLGLKQEDIMLMIKKSPGILTSRIEETLDEKIDVLYHLNVLPPFSMKDVLKIVKKCPDLISTCTAYSLEDKVYFLLKELGFYRRQLRNMILKQPSILTFSQESMKAKLDYCFRQLGVSVPDIARCPRVWQCSLTRLRERHLFLKHLKLITDDTHIDDFGLGKIVTPSDKVFAEQIARKSVAEYQEFTKKIANK